VRVAGRLYPPHDVGHRKSLAPQIVDDDASMATPPDGLGAHDSHSVVAGGRRACPERACRGIIGVIPKGIVAATEVLAKHSVPGPAAQAASNARMAIPIPPRRATRGAARHWNCGFVASAALTHVRQQIDRNCRSSCDELRDAPLEWPMVKIVVSPDRASREIMSEGMRSRSHPAIRESNCSQLVRSSTACATLRPAKKMRCNHTEIKPGLFG